VSQPLPFPVVRGRGASFNPPNRFERIRVERERWTDPDDPPPQTELLRDATRSILSRNDSPDVGFDVGINPYRGCSHGCSYCLAPDTPVLYADMSWRPIGAVRVGHVLVGFDEHAPPGRKRKLRPSVVQRVWWSRKPTVRLVTDEVEIVTTSEHRWLDGSARWTHTRNLEPGRSLRALPTIRSEQETRTYRRGYVGGLTLGDGTFRYEPGQRSDKLGFPQAWWRIAMKDVEPLARTLRYLKEDHGIHLPLRTFDPGRGAPRLGKIETRSLGTLSRLHDIVRHASSTREYARGFLAGFFDAEDSNAGSLRISQVDLSVLERVQGYAVKLGFDLVLERRHGRASTLRLRGSVADRLRFFGVCQPAIRRKVEALFGYRPPTTPAALLAVEPAGPGDVVDIQTSTRTFFAGGLATHNCYARPTHEYLGFSAGLDFETKILVKQDAPGLLRAALSSARWTPQPIMLSGNTDAYQPAERRLRITRRCLEVLAEFRNPVSIITKSYLVGRDVDLLGELARHRAAAVVISVTTLRNEVQRAMEPRASTPGRRLGAIRVLADAGIPVGVNVAPVVPGLTDHELPAILEAAARAGATFASYIVLRLPHGVKELFETWLAQHFPDRKEKVLNRVRALRGGKLYDARYAVRGRGEGPWAEQLRALFHVTRDRLGMDRPPELSTASFRRPGATPRPQLDLFGT